MSAFLDSLGELISDHWVKVLFLLIGAVLSLAWKYFWDRHAWKRRQGTETLHLSCNTIEDRDTPVTRTGDDGKTISEVVSRPWLILDGIFEDDLGNKISNRYVRQLIKRAISKTTIDQPFLRFGFSDDDHWFVMNMIRMGIAEIKGGDSLEKLANSPAFPISDMNCVFAVTYERWPGMRQGKIRIMLAREDDIASDRFAQEFHYEDPHHIDRPKTLIQMTRDYQGPKKYTMTLRIPVRSA